MPSAAKPRRTLEDLEQAAEVYRPVQDRIVYQVAVDQVRPSPHNPRRRMDGIDDLAESLRDYGLLQPVVVRHVDGGYELIAGHRRLEAARSLGWADIAAVVRHESDSQAYLLTLTENLQRQNLSPRELSGIASGPTPAPTESAAVVQTTSVVLTLAIFRSGYRSLLVRRCLQAA